MRTISASDLRRNLAVTLDSVSQNRDAIIITRDRGRPAAVLMSWEDYEALTKTNHLLRSPRNADRLLAATRSLDAGQGETRNLVE